MASPLTKATSCDSGAHRYSQESEDRDSTREWLETILEGYHTDKQSEHCPDIEVREWRIGAVRHDAGAMENLDDAQLEADLPALTISTSSVESSLMEMLCVSVSYRVCGTDAALDMVAKLLPHDPMTRAFVTEWALDRREIRCYTEVLPALESVCPGLPVPICYYATHKENAESALVLEDLSSRGFRMESLTRGLSLPQASSALRAIAKIHAASLVYKVKHKVDMRQKFPYLLSVEQAVASFQSLVNRGLPLLIKFLQNKTEHKGIREKLQSYQQSKNLICNVIKRAFEPSSKLNTLVHCDFWVNNLLFSGKDDQTLCFLVDWQLVTYGSPAIDLSLLLTTSLTPDVRRDYRKTLLTTYWSEFKFYVSDLGCEDELKDYGVLELEEDMRRAEAMAALVMVGSVDLALGVPRREERVLSILRDYFEAKII